MMLGVLFRLCEGAAQGYCPLGGVWKYMVQIGVVSTYQAAVLLLLPPRAWLCMHAYVYVSLRSV